MELQMIFQASDINISSGNIKKKPYRNMNFLH